MMHQCMSGGHAVKECQQENHGLAEKNWHKNTLKLKSILLSLMSIVKIYGIHVKIFSDSTTAIACINKLGTTHLELCHHITKQIWE